MVLFSGYKNHICFKSSSNICIDLTEFDTLSKCNYNTLEGIKCPSGTKLEIITK